MDQHWSIIEAHCAKFLHKHFPESGTVGSFCPDDYCGTIDDG